MFIEPNGIVEFMNLLVGNDRFEKPHDLGRDFRFHHKVRPGEAEQVTHQIGVKNQGVHIDSLWTMHKRNDKWHPLPE